ncbi:hypothetical protein HYC85_031538 [Camellia sinensis]|uniref:Aminotransferase class I/classII large domain-containing protein n=1 Tax=Camellia sinensis TaxID=4442 RepID=A0A7J7FQY9_CAMSI|nr:hypothetical protein HYC85_031538 [Camellia sinensis]
MWAKSKGIPLLASISELLYLLCIVWKQWLVTEKAKRQWEKYKSMLDDAKAMKEKIDEELSSGTQENAAVSDNPVIEQQRVATVQGLSGTGSLRLLVALIERYLPGAKVVISPPTWGEYCQSNW